MLCYARISQFDGAQFWIVLFIVTAILSKIIWCVLQFDTGQTMRFSGKFWSFWNAICIFWFWIPRNKPNKDSTETLVRKGSDWSWRCQGALGRIYKSTDFLSAFNVWKFQLKLHWIFNCDFWIWTLCTFTDRISQTHEDDTFSVHVVTSRSDCWIDSTLLY